MKCQNPAMEEILLGNLFRRDVYFRQNVSQMELPMLLLQQLTGRPLRPSDVCCPFRPPAAEFGSFGEGGRYGAGTRET
jgi:hypothetical protein